MKKTTDDKNKILIIKEKIDALTKELNELVKDETEENKKEQEKQIAALKKKFEKKWVAIIDTDDYVYITKVTDINDEYITINGVLITIGRDYNEYDDDISNISGFDYEISDFKIIKKEKVISELENEKKDRIKCLDKMIKNINAIQ